MERNLLLMALVLVVGVALGGCQSQPPSGFKSQSTTAVEAQIASLEAQLATQAQQEEARLATQAQQLEAPLPTQVYRAWSSTGPSPASNGITDSADFEHPSGEDSKELFDGLLILSSQLPSSCEIYPFPIDVLQAEYPPWAEKITTNPFMSSDREVIEGLFTMAFEEYLGVPSNTVLSIWMAPFYADYPAGRAARRSSQPNYSDEVGYWAIEFRSAKNAEDALLNISSSASNPEDDRVAYFINQNILVMLFRDSDTYGNECFRALKDRIRQVAHIEHSQQQIFSPTAELSRVQAAMDAMMAHHRLLNVEMNPMPVDTFVALPTVGATPPTDNDGDGTPDNYEYLYPSFINVGGASDPLACTYTWDNTAFVIFLSPFFDCRLDGKPRRPPSSYFKTTRPQDRQAPWDRYHP